jgi:hypothetical protein
MTSDGPAPKKDPVSLPLTPGGVIPEPAKPAETPYILTPRRLGYGATILGAAALAIGGLIGHYTAQSAAAQAQAEMQRDYDAKIKGVEQRLSQDYSNQSASANEAKANVATLQARLEDVTARLEAMKKIIKWLEERNLGKKDVIYKYSFTVELFESYPGLDVSALNKPVTKIIYNKEDDAFDFDAAYTELMRKEIDKITNQIEMMKKQTYQQLITKADEFFKNEK